MASTTIAAAVVRTITTDYLAAEMPSAAKLIASGAVTVDPTPPFFSGNVPGGVNVAGTPSARYVDTDFVPCAVICDYSCPQEWTSVRNLLLDRDLSGFRLFLRP